MANPNQDCSASISDIFDEFKVIRIDDTVCECRGLNLIVEYDHLESKGINQSSCAKHSKSVNRSTEKKDPFRQSPIIIKPAML
jgi:hypothetical protein